MRIDDIEDTVSFIASNISLFLHILIVIKSINKNTIEKPFPIWKRRFTEYSNVVTNKKSLFRITSFLLKISNRIEPLIHYNFIL